MKINFEDLLCDVYEVYTTVNDGVQGKLVGVFSSYESAYNAAKGKGWYGTTGLIIGARGVIVDNKVYVLKHNPVIINSDLQAEKEKEIDNILDKLSPEEIKKLNIDRDKLKKDIQPVDSPNFPFNIPA